MEQQRYQRTQHSRLISNQLGPDRKLVPGGDWTMEQQRYQRTQHSRLISNQLGPDRQLDY
jgi:outer membrane receptor for monomeric catechols